MKVLVIHTAYIQRGGEDIVYESEVKLLRERGVDVETILFTNKRYSWLKFLLGMFNPFSFFRVLRMIKKFDPDVIHVHNWFFAASPSIFVAARMRKKPVVHTLHNFRILCPSGVLFYDNHIYMESVTKVFPFDAVKNKVYRNSLIYTFWVILITRINYYFGTWQGINKFISLTDNGKEIFRHSYLHLDLDKIEVKPNFFDADGLGEPDSKGIKGDHFLYIGRLAKEKGIDVLLESFKQNKFPITIVGEGPLLDQVIAAAEEVGSINYVGRKEKPEILQELYNCSALVMPSICYEPFGLVIIEAFACGIPVIASNTGAPADIILDRKNGLLFEAGDSSSLTLQASYWSGLTNTEISGYRRAARSSFESHYTKSINLNILLRIYNRTINNNALPKVI